MKKTAFAVLFSLSLLFAMSYSPAIAAEPMDQQLLVEQAQTTLSEFQSAPDMQWFRMALKNAKGVLIIPDLYKAGLIIGGSGGKGVYMAKDAETGEWRGPAFYNIGTFTLGFQAGGEISQVVILAMTDDAANDMLSPKFQLGSDASAAIGQTGIGVSGYSAVPSAAFISFARSKGLYGGANLEGSVIKPDGEYNTIYYGKYVTPEEVFVTGAAMTTRAAALRKDMATAESADERSRD